MADVKETVIIEAKTEGEDDVKKLSKAINDSKDATEKQTKASEDLAKQNKKTAKDGKKGFLGLNGAVKSVGTGFKVLGTAMKAAGIGLIVGLVFKLTQAFSQNQAIMDGVNKIFTTINIVFQQLTSAITNAFQSVSQATGGFQALGKVISGLLTLALTPLKVGFFGIKLALQQAQLAWEQSVFGDDDPATVKRLNEEIANTKKELIEVGADAVNAGKDIIDNFGDAVGEIGDFTKTAVNNISDISIAGAIATSERIVNLRNQAKLAESVLAGLTLQFQKDAELQRQIRDDIALSIDDRIKANEKLSEILKEQLKEELSVAQIRLKLANEELALNKENIDAQIAKQEALNVITDINERITGQASEQLTNERALQEERKANLEELRLLGTTEAERKAIESETELERQRTLIERTVSNEQEKNRLLELAEQEHQNRLDEIRQEGLDEIAKAKEAEKKINQEKEKADKEQAKNQKELIKESIGEIANAVGLGKEFAIAQALFDTYESAQKSYNSLAGIPIVGPALGVAAAAAAVAGGLGQVASIKSVKTPNVAGASGGGGQGGGQSAPPQPPSFNLIGNANTSAITQPITEGETPPVQAFVVSRDVTTAQQADRNAESASTF